jgi:hypothetical protein
MASSAHTIPIRLFPDKHGETEKNLVGFLASM